MQALTDLPEGMKTRVIVKTFEDGSQIVTNDQGDELLSFTPADPKIVTAPNPEVQFLKGEYRHPTKAVHKESKKRRQMARRSRKINRKKRTPSPTVCAACFSIFLIARTQIEVFDGGLR